MSKRRVQELLKILINLSNEFKRCNKSEFASRVLIVTTFPTDIMENDHFYIMAAGHYHSTPALDRRLAIIARLTVISPLLSTLIIFRIISVESENFAVV